MNTITIRGTRHPIYNLGIIRVHVKCEKPKIDKQFPFIVDTGASLTVISEGDAIELGVDYAELTKIDPEPKIMRGIGGSSLCYRVNNAELWFEVKEDEWHVEKIDKLGIMKHQNDEVECPACGKRWMWREEERARHAKSMPSLLGVDVLHKFKIRITSKQIFLEN